MKTIYHTKDVWMNRYSIKIEPIPGTRDAHVRVYYNETPEKNDQWQAYWGADNFLSTTPIPAIDRRETARAIENLIVYHGLVDITLFDTRDGWGVHITLCPELENLYLRGTGATPADAIRNSAPYPPPLRNV